MSFNFNYWKTLYETNPEQFEIERRLVLTNEARQITEDESKQNRLLAHVNRMDMELGRIKNPTERFNQSQQYFWRQFFRLKEVLNGNITEPEKKEGTILEFKPNERQE